jgi:tetratricopeptide (TPR) repeat protein
MESNNLLRFASATLLGALVFASSPALSAQSASALVTSGLDKYRDGNMDGAVADFTKALELNPSYIGAYNNRGLAKSAQGNFDGAIADYSAAIKLKPAYVEAYFNRGTAEFFQGNFDAAITDYTKTLELKPDHQAACFYRAMSREGQGDFEGAHADYAKALELKGGGDADYLLLHSALLSRRMGQGNDERLKTAAKWTNEWAKTLALFLDDQLTEDELMKRAAAVADDDQRPVQQNEALYFAGVVKLIGGDKAGARADFQKCFDASGPATVVHRMSRTELDRG